MLKIPLSAVKSHYDSFNALPATEREALARRFQAEQPIMSSYLLEQDQEWFREGSQVIWNYGFFAWSVFCSVGRASPPRVTDEMICRLLEEGNARIDLLDFESEHRAN